MTNEDKKSPSTKAEIKTLGGILTVQNVAQIAIFIVTVAIFYQKTNDRIEALEIQQRQNASRIQYHEEWLGIIAVKTQTPPPPAPSQ